MVGVTAGELENAQRSPAEEQARRHLWARGKRQLRCDDVVAVKVGRSVIEELAREANGLFQTVETLPVRGHLEPDRLESAARPAGAEAGVDAFAAVDEREVRELPEQEERVLNPDVRHERRHAEPLGVGRYGCEHGEAFRGHRCDRARGRRGRDEWVVALNHSGQPELFVPSGYFTRSDAVERVRARPGKRGPELNHVRSLNERASRRPVDAERSIASQTSAAR